MEIKFDVNKTKRMVNMSTAEKFKVVVGSEHMVEDVSYVVAVREGKRGYVRVAKITLRDNNDN